MTGSSSMAMPEGFGAIAVAGERSSIVGLAAGAFFSIRSILVLVTAQWLNIGTQPGVELSLVMSVAFLLLALMQAFGNVAYPLSPVKRIAVFRWLVLYLAFSAASLLWTAAASPPASALYWGALACDVLTVLLIFRGSGGHAGIHAVMKGYIAGSCLLAAIAWMMPVAEDLRLGVIEYFNTNQIANICALAVFLCLILAARTGQRWQLPIAFLTLTLFRSLSKSTLVAFVVSAGILLLRHRGMSRKMKAGLVITAALLLFVSWGLLEAYFSIYTTASDQAETLTGRTAIWLWALGAALQHPWFGNGIDAMWKVAPPFGGELFEARHAENELLQQFFAYGVCGVIMLAGLYSSLWRHVRRLANASERSAVRALIAFVLIRGFAEAEPFDLLLPLWIITAILLLATDTQNEPTELVQPDKLPAQAAVR